MIFGLILAFAAIIAVEAPGLIRRKMWGELAVFFAYLMIAMIFFFAQALGIDLSPVRPIQTLFDPLSLWLNSR